VLKDEQMARQTLTFVPVQLGLALPQLQPVPGAPLTDFRFDPQDTGHATDGFFCHLGGAAGEDLLELASREHQAAGLEACAERRTAM
jgi:hypothetical protein